jgi:hypothetical protein
VNISGSLWKEWAKEKFGYEICLNHYEGLGESEVINGLCAYISRNVILLHPVDVAFLRKISGDFSTDTSV